ncbi:hypothetical protein VPHK567_0373 [Vibrio phage K567]
MEKAGLYRVYWESGGSSVGVLFMTHSKPAMMFSNWTCKDGDPGYAYLDDLHDSILRYELVTTS